MKTAIKLLPVAVATLHLSVGGGLAASFELSHGTIDGGGGASAGGGFELTGTIGQPDTAESCGPDWFLAAGFWTLLNPLGSNTAPVWLGLEPSVFQANTPDQAIDLTQGFDDQESGAAGLTYDILSVSGDTHIGDSPVIDNVANALLLTKKHNLLGVLTIRVRAMDPGCLTAEGDHVIQVVGSTFLQWLNANFPPEVLSDPDQQDSWGEDGDGDADDNSTLGEAYHGGNPLFGEDIPYEPVAFDDATGEYLFRWTRAAPGNGVIAVIQWSLNLKDWYPSGGGPSGDGRTVRVLPGPIEGDEQVIEARVPGAADGRIFTRLIYQIEPLVK